MIYTDGTHLVGTHEQELHDFAESIGLKRSWFQVSNPDILPRWVAHYPHYHLFTGSIKHKAIAAGAVLIPSDKIIEMFQLLELQKHCSLSDQSKIDQQLNNLHL